MREIVIGFCGRMGSGKTTSALHLVDNGFTRLRFAGPLKAMLQAAGLTPDQTDGDLKEVPSALLCGRTPRHAMQTLGTEWGRHLIGDDFWAHAWGLAADKVEQGGLAADSLGHWASGRYITVDDVRFPNEAAAIRSRGGIVVEIQRPGLPPPAAAHVSETYDLRPDFVIGNNSTPADLFAKLNALIRPLVCKSNADQDNHLQPDACTHCIIDERTSTLEP